VSTTSCIPQRWAEVAARFGMRTTLSGGRTCRRRRFEASTPSRGGPLGAIDHLVIASARDALARPCPTPVVASSCAAGESDAPSYAPAPPAHCRADTGHAVHAPPQTNAQRTVSSSITWVGTGAPAPNRSRGSNCTRGSRGWRGIDRPLFAVRRPLVRSRNALYRRLGSHDPVLVGVGRRLTSEPQRTQFNRIRRWIRPAAAV
jgi:hypothetical protein